MDYITNPRLLIFLIKSTPITEEEMEIKRSRQVRLLCYYIRIIKIRKIEGLEIGLQLIIG